MFSKVEDYIKENWKNTIRQSGVELHGIVKIPFSYTTPCMDEAFIDFYYWDTYFTNRGLLRCDMKKQVENNLDTMKYFIDAIGYVPNANHILDRSQPPLFTAGVWDLYHFTKDTHVIEKYIDSIIRELDFWEYDRMTPCGLNAYGTNASRVELINNCEWLCERVGVRLPENIDDRIRMCRNLYSIAESGWDFTPRFQTERNCFEADEFVELDLNCILYDAEVKTAKMLRVVNRDEEAERLEEKYKNRKILMDHYMKDPKTGIYYDYNFRKNCFSSITSCASFYVYAMGISNNKQAAAKLLKRLELPYGLAACEKRPGEVYLQWDYPAMWPSNVYFAVHGLKEIGLYEEAKRIAIKYVDTVNVCFEKTGLLWEKYDALKGSVSVTREYDTPSMMGWTAGVYLDMQHMIKGLK